MTTENQLIARNPATDAELARIATTTPNALEEMVVQARSAQARWELTAWAERKALLRRWWCLVTEQADTWAEAITVEIGKPRDESRIEVCATLDQLRWLVQHAGSVLADRRIGPGWQRWMGMSTARLRWVPHGVLGKLGTWNYPLFLNVSAIAAALAAGNAVVWKPSEHASWIGQRIQRDLDSIGSPPALVQTAFGGPDVGRSLIASSIDKGMITGGPDAGRNVLGELGRRGLPGLAELSGFDPAIVLSDAPRDPTLRALTWAAFVGCGQTCVAVKRVYVLGDATPWADALAEQAGNLRVGDPARDDVDVGPMITHAARDRFDQQVRDAVSAGARVLCGGTIPPDQPTGAFYSPTVLLADLAHSEAPLAGCFGPVVIVRGMANLDEAIEAANASPFGLAASVWGQDRRMTRSVADRLRAGMVGINDAVTLAAHAHAPFGGRGASGFGRVHGAWGLREFAQTQVVHVRRPGGLRPQLFPYGRRLTSLLALYRRFFHGSRR
jgi:acyl-CoA reductase-like NAD-dependent aldehyde dehydrogenase